MIDISSEGETLEACAAVLQEVFGYEAFRGPQAGIVTHVSDGDTVWVQPLQGGEALNWIVEPFLIAPDVHGWMAPFAVVFLSFGLALFWMVAGFAARGRFALLPRADIPTS